MEHRRNKRLPIRREAWVEFPGQHAIAVCTHDMSLNGTFLETPDLLPPNAIVRLVFRDIEHDTCLAIPAIITHRHSDGIGLMYGNLSHSMQRQIRAILNNDPNLLDTQTAVV